MYLSYYWPNFDTTWNNNNNNKNYNNYYKNKGNNTLNNNKSQLNQWPELDAVLKQGFWINNNNKTKTMKILKIKLIQSKLLNSAWSFVFSFCFHKKETKEIFTKAIFLPLPQLCMFIIITTYYWLLVLNIERCNLDMPKVNLVACYIS